MKKKVEAKKEVVLYSLKDIQKKIEKAGFNLELKKGYTKVFFKGVKVAILHWVKKSGEGRLNLLNKDNGKWEIPLTYEGLVKFVKVK